MVVHWAVEVLPVSHMPPVVVFGALNVEVGYPPQLTIDVPVLGDAGIVGHPSAFDFVHLEWVFFTFGLDEDGLFRLELFVEKLFVVSVVFIIEKGGAVVVTLIPLLIGGGKHAVVCVLLHDHFYSGLSVGGVGRAHSCLLFENASESCSSKRRFSIQGRYWWSELRINDNVFSIGHFDVS